GDLEAAALDHDGAVTLPLHAVVSAGEGEAQRIAVGARPRHVALRAEALGENAQRDGLPGAGGAGDEGEAETVESDWLAACLNPRRRL
ncbi:MAG: hypothetical protein WAL40_05665, partial [Rhodoplanes sp.]